MTDMQVFYLFYSVTTVLSIICACSWLRLRNVESNSQVGLFLLWLIVSFLPIVSILLILFYFILTCYEEDTFFTRILRIILFVRRKL